MTTLSDPTRPQNMVCRVPVVRVDPAREERELAAYLGERFDRERLVRWEQTLEDEAARVGDEQTLYRTSEAYLYNLTAFAMTQTKAPYLAELARLVAPPAHVLEFGCGIGSDGLALLEAGYDVTFADFDNPSTCYLRWRLEQRGLHACVVDVDREPVPGGFDAAFAFDVLEHLEDPFATLRTLEERARIVVVNLLAPDPHDTALHRALPIGALLEHAVDRGLLRHRLLHGRSHLIAYAPGGRGSWRARRSARRFIR